LFEREGKDGSIRLMFPSAVHFSDYLERVIELITAVSEVEDRHPVQVLDDILQCDARGKADSLDQSSGGDAPPIRAEHVSPS
jgi:hypothetical protein